MNKIKQALLFYLLLCVRFCKKISFLLLLCAVPILVFCLRNVSEQDSGILHIVLCLENKEDAMAQRIADRLMSEESVLYFSLVQEKERAQELVLTGEADAAWIFPDDFQEMLDAFVRGDIVEESLILVVEREDNVALQLSRLKLFGALYPDLSYTLYRDFVSNDLLVGEDIPEAELQSLYDQEDVEDSLFRLACLDTETSASVLEQSYMAAPIRGMLSLVVILCGFAANMYFMQDEEKGVLDNIAVKGRYQYAYAYQLASMVPVSAAVLAALFLLGDFTTIGMEFSMMAFYLADCMVFCSLFRKICGSSQRLGTCIPVLMLGMFALCPVLFTVKKFRLIQYLLPPFHYLEAVRVHGQIGNMVLYGMVGIGLDVLAERLKNRF